jgi:hypothetical protein
MLIQLKEALSGGWITLLIATASSALGMTGGYLAAYLKIKAEHLATKEDFQETLRQVRQNTKTVEEVKAAIGTETALKSELRQTVKEFAIGAGGMLHSICWLTWDCKMRKRLNDEMVKGYDLEAHKLSPQIVSQLAVIAMLDHGVHEKLGPLADRIFRLDAAVGNAVIETEQDSASGLNLLAAIHHEATEFERSFRNQVIDLFGTKKV